MQTSGGLEVAVNAEQVCDLCYTSSWFLRSAGPLDLLEVCIVLRNWLDESFQKKLKCKRLNNVDDGHSIIISKRDSKQFSTVVVPSSTSWRQCAVLLKLLSIFCVTITFLYTSHQPAISILQNQYWTVCSDDSKSHTTGSIGQQNWAWKPVAQLTSRLLVDKL